MPDEIILPFDRDAEAAALGSAMIDRHAYEAIAEKLRPLLDTAIDKRW